MPALLLQTKLYAPPIRPNLVTRPRLTDQLNQGLQLGHKLTLVSAPAGFGKTTLVGEWVNGNQRPVAWLSLDQGDNDFTRFLTYLVAALQTPAQAGLDGVRSDFGEEILDLLKTSQPPSTDSILTALLNELATIPGDLVLALDDYHLVEAPAVDQALSFFIEHLPPQLHLVIATREDPNLPLARLRGRGQLTELRATDLRFTDSEAADFLNRVMDLNLSAADVVALESRTEGWIAGLQLAAISMRGDRDRTSFIKAFTGSHQYVLDYLVEEVIDQQPGWIQDFLLQTAILDRLNGSLCDAVCTGLDEEQANQAGGQKTLEYLQQANLFIIPLDDSRHWFRYHHLFASLLRQRLRQTQPMDISRLHLRAARWFSHHDYNQEAIKHLLAASDFQSAAKLIKTIAIDTMQQGSHTTVTGWINALPNDLVKGQPYLCVLHAWSLQLAGQMETAEARLVDAETALERSSDQDENERNIVRGLINSHRAYLSFVVGEQDKTIAYAEQALVQLPESADLIRAQTALYQAVAYRYHGQLKQALKVYNKVVPVTRKMGNKAITALGHLHQGDLHYQMARLHKSHDTYQQALQLTCRQAGDPELPFCGYIYVGIGRIFRQWNQLDKAYKYTSKGLDLCRDWNQADILALSCIEWAYINLAMGYADQAQASLQEVLQIYDGFSPWGVKLAAAHKAQMDLTQGHIEAAGRWAQQVDLPLNGEFVFHRENEYLALVRVLIAQERIEQAQMLAGLIHQKALASDGRLTKLQALILLALIYANQADIDQALDHLETALKMAEPEDFIRLFVDEGQPMARLLSEALNRQVRPVFVRRLLAAFPDDLTKTATPPPPTTQPGLIEPLSERELEVLQLVALGLTNREIANRLYLSLNTIKVHTRNIYGKLGVNNRTQAVLKARTLGIFPSS